MYEEERIRHLEEDIALLERINCPRCVAYRRKEIEKLQTIINSRKQ